MRTLIVDDHDNFTFILQSMLRSIGATQIFRASNDQEGFRILRNESINLLLVDQNLGRGDEGVEFVRQIRASRHASRHVSIMMISAYTEQGRVMTARDAGINEFLVKPFSARELVVRLDMLLNRSRDFAQSATYFGPDRRRRRAPPGYEGPELRTDDD